MRTLAPKRALILSVSTCLALSLAACGSSGSSAASGSAAPEASQAATSAEQVEVADLDPRVAIAYDGGILVLDSATGETLADVKKEGFLRLNPAGDNRHVLVTSSAGFEVLDLGLIVKPHGDHNHYYTTTPVLTGSTVPADHAGHVVTHADHTALFADGTGTVTTYEVAALEDGQLAPDELTSLTTSAPHHGVAVPMSNGNTMVTQGTEDERHTVQVLAPDGSVVTETTDCPGVHGEATAQGEDVFSIGCTNGSVVYRDGQFHKVPVPEDYQRSGNQFGSPASPYVLTDYKTIEPTEDGELERPTQVGILNTTDATTTTLDLGSAYWFRSFARGADGEGLVLTYDGKLNIIDMEAGTVTNQVDVVTPWEENDDWQQPGPNVKAAGDFAYVTDPTAQKLHIIQISTGQILSSFDLAVVPNEMTVVDAETSHGQAHHDHGEEAHSHSDEEHDHADEEHTH